jgi:hypothetical protein
MEITFRTAAGAACIEAVVAAKRAGGMSRREGHWHFASPRSFLCRQSYG